MGLDQNANSIDGGILKACEQVDFNDKLTHATKEEIQYWRKHPNLQGWMENLYREKGGSAESFNCVPVRIEAEDLDRLERDVETDTLPNTVGFFFGESCESDKLKDREFIRKSREALRNGKVVYYSSWW